MVNWFNIINIQNIIIVIVLVGVGYIWGRYGRLVKKIIKGVQNENQA